MVARRRGSRQFGNLGNAERRYPSAHPYYIYIGIYTYYTLSIYMTDNRDSREPVLSRWKGSRFPLGSQAATPPSLRAETAGKTFVNVKKSVATGADRLIRFSCRNQLELPPMTPDQACITFKMARMAFNQYRREIAAGEARGNFLAEQHDALSAMARELSERFPEPAADGYFRLPRI